MALFGKKNNNNDNEEKTPASDLDAKIMAAIEETDLEEQQLREQKVKDALDRAEEVQKRRDAEDEKRRKVEEFLKTLPNEGRRYFLMNEGASERDGLVEVKGNVRGEVKPGDIVYVYKPDLSAVTSKVVKVISLDDEELKETSSVKNGRAVLSLELPEGTEVPKYSVVSSVQPMVKFDKSRPVENPLFLGLSLEYKEFHADKEYMDRLITAVINARFLSPSREDGVSSNGKKTLKLLSLKDPEEEGKRMIPVFTDPGALMVWKDVMQGEDKPKVAVISFDIVAQMARKDGTGLVVNPFGPVPIRFPQSLIERILDMDGYKTFIEKKKELQTGAAPSPDGKVKIFLAEPPATEETDKIRKELIKCCSGMPEVAKAGLIAKLQSSKSSYLIIVDCPEGTEQRICAEIFKAVKPHMNTVKKLEFASYNSAPFAVDYFSKHEIDYVKS